MDVSAARLCYLDASRVMAPTGMLAAFDVRSSHDQTLGSIDGILIDPEARQLRFFVVERDGAVNHQRYLLPVEAAASVSAGGHSLKIDMESADFDALDEFHMADVRAFTAEDAIAPTLTRYLS